MGTAWSQVDPMFSQYNSNRLLMNPANAGVFNGNLRVASNYRRQWENIGSPFQTIGLGADWQLGKERGTNQFGMGLTVLSDNAGLSNFSHIQVGVPLSYTRALDAKENHYFSIGAQVGFAQKSVSALGLNWGNQWDGTGFDPTTNSGENFANESVSYLDFSGGLMYYFVSRNEKVRGYMSGATYHINRPSQNFLGGADSIHARNVIAGGIDIKAKNKIMVYRPSFFYQGQGGSQHFVYGFDLQFVLGRGTRYTGYSVESSLSLGLYHRWDDAVIPRVEIQKGGFTLGIAYDITYGNLSRANGGTGGPEFGLNYRVGYKKGSRNRRKPINDKFF